MNLLDSKNTKDCKSSKKAISHVHTHHSFDCRVPPQKIVLSALKLGIDYLLISDHDTLAGSIEACEFALQKKFAIQIPIAAEVCTYAGDIIVADVPKDFALNKNDKILCKTAKDLGGYTILPHPYKGHKLESIDFDLIDYIEVYNSRCSFQENMQAFELAQKLGKPVVYGSDAHTLADLSNAVFAYTGDFSFQAKTIPLQLMPTPWMHNEYSKIIRAVKLREPKEILRVIKRSLMRCFKAPSFMRKSNA